MAFIRALTDGCPPGTTGGAYRADGPSGEESAQLVFFAGLAASFADLAAAFCEDLAAFIWALVSVLAVFVAVVTARAGAATMASAAKVAIIVRFMSLISVRLARIEPAAAHYDDAL